MSDQGHILNIGDRRGPDPLALSIEINNRIIDAVFQNALATSRVAGLPIEDVPRFCLSAACRVLERMIESYGERMEKGTAEEMKHRQQQIYVASDDLLQAIAEAHNDIKKIQESIAGTIPRPS